MLKLGWFPRKWFSYYIRCPFDLKYFSQQQTKNLLKKSVSSRFRDPSIVDEVSSMLSTYKKSLFQLEQINKSINSTQRFIKTLKKGKSQIEAQDQEVKQKISLLGKEKQKQKQLEAQVKNLTISIQQKIMKVGNIVDHITPISKDQAKNQVISQYIPMNGLLQHSVSYSQICQRFKLTDLKRGQKVGGHRGYFLRNQAVKLSLALANYGLQFLQEKGYSIYYSPAIINETVLKGSCQLQSIQQDVYKLEGTDSYLIATSQQSLAGLFKQETLQRSQLPVRLAGYSSCFRKQAGAHGKDIHGIFRVHQFEKVQQFTIVQEEFSQQQMKRMMNISEQFYKSLEIPYRVVNIVSGELNDAASCKFDLEAWYPSQKKYRELVSVSNCTSYQSRLLKVQYQGAGNKSKYPHMLNGTLIAIQRALTCIIENNYQQKYIKIPKVLQGWTKRERIQMPER